MGLSPCFQLFCVIPFLNDKTKAQTKQSGQGKELEQPGQSEDITPFTKPPIREDGAYLPPVPQALLCYFSACGYVLLIIFFPSMKDTSSTDVSRKILPEISQITQSLMEKWIASAAGSTEREVAKR